MKRKLLFIIALLSFTSLFAIEMPIQRLVKLELPIGKMSIIEFPFEIQGMNASNFVYKIIIKKKKTNGLENAVPSDTNNKKKISKRKIVKKNAKPVIIQRGKRTVTLLPSRTGKFTLLVYGYKYPILIDIRIVKKSDIREIIFKDYSNNKRYAAKFEAVPHEKVIVKLIKYLYNNKTPKGYDYENGIFDYEAQGLKIVQIKRLIGLRYEGDEYIIQNLTTKTIKLYPQMFYNNYIYAIAFENNILKPHKKVRMFVITKKGM